MSTDNIIFLSNVRLSFPHLVEPQKQMQPDGKETAYYNCEFIMPPNHPGLAQFMKLYGEMALEKWKEHATNAMNQINSERKQRCYGRGEEKINKKTFAPYAGYEGQIYISAKKNTAPQMIQADGTPVDPSNTMAYQALARKMYGGCRVNAAIKPWIQANKHGNGIRCELVAIQFLADDQPFGEGATDASGLFGAVQQTAPASTATPAGMGLPPFMMGQ